MGGGRRLAAVAALAGLALLAGCGARQGVQPSAAQPSGTPSTARPVPLVGRDWSRVQWPFRCAGVPVRTTDRVVIDLTGDGLPEVVLVAFCDAGAGSPPQHLLVFDGASPPGPPRLLAELSAPGIQLFIRVSAAGGVIRATGLGYSGPTVPRCCPDISRQLAWRWSGRGFAPAG